MNSESIQARLQHQRQEMARSQKQLAPRLAAALLAQREAQEQIAPRLAAALATRPALLSVQMQVAREAGALPVARR